MPKLRRDDFDSPWKDLLEKYFQQFMEFFFPKVANDIDWSQKHEFLDKEFQQIVRDANLGRRYADKLVRVKQKNGAETWVLVHIEIQGDKDADMAKRMFVYHYRIFDRYEKKVANLALLADTNENWRPSDFNYELWGCSLDFHFPTAKLLDFKDRKPTEGAPPNPFSVAVATHLKAKATHNDMPQRAVYKGATIKALYQAGFKRSTIIELVRFIDWILALPPDLDKQLKTDIFKFEEEQKMRYITSFERIATQEGLDKGLAEGLADGLTQAIELALKLKFGTNGLKILPEIKQIKDPLLLETIVKNFESAKTLDDLCLLYKISETSTPKKVSEPPKPYGKTKPKPKAKPRRAPKI